MQCTLTIARLYPLPGSWSESASHSKSYSVTTTTLFKQSLSLRLITTWLGMRKKDWRAQEKGDFITKMAMYSFDHIEALNTTHASLDASGRQLFMVHWKIKRTITSECLCIFVMIKRPRNKLSYYVTNPKTIGRGWNHLHNRLSPSELLF